MKKKQERCKKRGTNRHKKKTSVSKKSFARVQYVLVSCGHTETGLAPLIKCLATSQMYISLSFVLSMPLLLNAEQELCTLNYQNSYTILRRGLSTYFHTANVSSCCFQVRNAFVFCPSGILTYLSQIGLCNKLLR